MAPKDWRSFAIIHFNRATYKSRTSLKKKMTPEPLQQLGDVFCSPATFVAKPAVSIAVPVRRRSTWNHVESIADSKNPVKRPFSLIQQHINRAFLHFREHAAGYLAVYLFERNFCAAVRSVEITVFHIPNLSAAHVINVVVLKPANFLSLVIADVIAIDPPYLFPAPHNVVTVDLDHVFSITKNPTLGSGVISGRHHSASACTSCTAGTP